MKRVTVTLPESVVEEIDRWESNRSRFLLVAAERELENRRREALERSLEHPHRESSLVAEEGLADWGRSMGDGDGGLVDTADGSAVTWTNVGGWSERPNE
jgi:Arc/MetJ-type ribon-helix-helix transcriptional regulator